ncbi:MAG: hypothetical protein ABJD11_08095 [Gemmatimonadota bacterium]
MKNLPHDLEDLDRFLSSIRFHPRASLEPEIFGRWRRGEAPGNARRSWLRGALGVSGLVVLLTAGIFGVVRPRLWPSTHQVDRCCQDLDGGGVADDGILVLADASDNVERLTLYEDRDLSGTFSAGDSLRFTRHGVLDTVGAQGADMTTTEFCCADYDGDGPTDDALIVMHDRTGISMAAIYEHGHEKGVLLR